MIRYNCKECAVRECVFTESDKYRVPTKCPLDGSECKWEKEEV